MKYRYGYTLMELSCVIGLVLIISMGTISGYNSMFKNTSYSQAENNRQIVEEYVSWIYYNNYNNIDVDYFITQLKSKLWLRNPRTKGINQQICVNVANNLNLSDGNSVVYVKSTSLYDIPTLDDIKSKNNLKGVVLVIMTTTSYAVYAF